MGRQVVGLTAAGVRRECTTCSSEFPIGDELWVQILLFAVPLKLASAEGELRHITTITSIETAADVTLAELSLEAFLSSTDRAPEVLHRRWG